MIHGSYCECGHHQDAHHLHRFTDGEELRQWCTEYACPCVTFDRARMRRLQLDSGLLAVIDGPNAYVIDEAALRADLLTPSPLPSRSEFDLADTFDDYAGQLRRELAMGFAIRDPRAFATVGALTEGMAETTNAMRRLGEAAQRNAEAWRPLLKCVADTYRVDDPRRHPLYSRRWWLALRRHMAHEFTSAIREHTSDRTGPR